MSTEIAKGQEAKRRVKADHKARQATLKAASKGRKKLRNILKGK